MCPVRFEQHYDIERARDSAIWFDGPLGRRVENAEMQRVRERIGNLFGAYGALIGPCRDTRILDALQVQHRIYAQVTAEVPGESGGGITAVSSSVVDPANLPFHNRALDALILFHALDISAHPHGGLREAARVLSDRGRLVITGFNPFSLWGVRRWLAGAATTAQAPWNHNFVNPVRLFDWLSLLDFRVEAVDYVLFRPPWFGTRLELLDWRPLDGMGQRLRLPVGGVYVVKAAKRKVAVRRKPQRLRRITPAPARSPAARPAGVGQAA